jgi:DNA-3-methyladenine glycosylase I
MGDELGTGADGIVRCRWPGARDDYVAYHDHEWGRPVVDDVRLFEKVCLEGFQAGLSWLTILRKRENFRTAFAGFDPAAVSRFDASDVERLLGDAGIVRHRGKIQSTINNAGRALDLARSSGPWPPTCGGSSPPASRGRPSETSPPPRPNPPP